MPSAAEECREPSGNCQGISHCLESGHPVCYVCVLLTMFLVIINIDVALRTTSYENYSYALEESSIILMAYQSFEQGSI